jgi:hypothetical protein
MRPSAEEFGVEHNDNERLICARGRVASTEVDFAIDHVDRARAHRSLPIVGEVPRTSIPPNIWKCYSAGRHGHPVLTGAPHRSPPAPTPPTHRTSLGYQRARRRPVGTQVRYSYWRGTTRPREAFHSGRVFAWRAPPSSALARLARAFLALVGMILSHLLVRRFVVLTPHMLEGEESNSRGLRAVFALS